MGSETGGQCPVGGDGGTPMNSDDDTTTSVDRDASSTSEFSSGLVEGDGQQTESKTPDPKELPKPFPKKIKKRSLKCVNKNKSHHTTPVVEEKTSTDSLDSPSYRIYVTSSHIGDQIEAKAFFERFRTTVDEILGGKRFKLYQTTTGLIATFYKEEELEKVLATDLAKKQKVPVQICKFMKTGPCYRRYVLIGRVPWCVPLPEVRSALLKLGLYPGKIARVRGDIRVELYNSSDVERLLLEGFNFYDSACYPTTLESVINFKNKEQEVVQCFRCQGYWHTSGYCREKPRCVRCGGNHELDYCLRPRSDPTCCHCGGPHHAAYKLCPVRVRLMKSTQIAFSISKNPDN